MNITLTEAKVTRNGSSKNAGLVEAIVKQINEAIKGGAEAEKVTVEEMQVIYPDLEHFDTSILNQVKKHFGPGQVAGRDTKKFPTKNGSGETSRITAIIGASVSLK